MSLEVVARYGAYRPAGGNLAGRHDRDASVALPTRPVIDRARPVVAVLSLAGALDDAMARPTKYSEEIAEQIAAGIRTGLTNRDAAHLAGIDETTLYRWERRF